MRFLDRFVIRLLCSIGSCRFWYTMQENIRVQDQADFWYLRSAPRARSGEVFLQFYKEGCRDPNWVQKGKFFIIRFDAHRNPEFRLGDYNAAIEHGVFNIID